MTRFVFFGDDDIYVNYRRLSKSLRSLEPEHRENTLHGQCVELYGVGEYESPGNGTLRRLTNCSTEAGFVLSMDAAKLLLNNFNTSGNLAMMLRQPPGTLVGASADKQGWEIIESTVFTSTKLAPYQEMSICLINELITFRDDPTLYPDWAQKLRNTSALRACWNPDVDLVLKKNVSNARYFAQVLQLWNDNPTCLSRRDGKTRRHLYAAFDIFVRG